QTLVLQCTSLYLIAVCPPVTAAKTPRVPSWWFVTMSQCYGRNDCDSDECCARPIMSSRNYCLPLKKRGDECDQTPHPLNKAIKAHYGSCPCEEDLTCATLNSKSACVNLKTLEDDFSLLLDFFFAHGAPKTSKVRMSGKNEPSRTSISKIPQ
ncbi:unnamed protein product, partial [Meganyctiphanes norvegica]